MAKLTFRGGVHPYDGKDLSKDKPMKTIVPKRGDGVSTQPAYWCAGGSGGKKG